MSGGGLGLGLDGGLEGEEQSPSFKGNLAWDWLMENEEKQSEGSLYNCRHMAISWVRPAAAAAAKSLQSYPTLCDPIDGSPPGSPVPGILQARILEWVAISFSNAWKWKVKVKSLSRVWFLATPWSAAYQAPPSMGFSRLEWGAIAFSGVRPEPGLNPSSAAIGYVT